MFPKSFLTLKIWSCLSNCRVRSMTVATVAFVLLLNYFNYFFWLTYDIFPWYIGKEWNHKMHSYPVPKYAVVLCIFHYYIKQTSGHRVHHPSNYNSSISHLRLKIYYVSNDVNLYYKILKLSYTFFNAQPQNFLKSRRNPTNSLYLNDQPS